MTQIAPETAPVRVKNKLREPFVLLIPLIVGGGLDDHGLAPVRASRSETVQLPDNTVGAKVSQVRVPASLTWLAGETKDLPKDLADALAKVPEFQAALVQRKLVKLDLPRGPLPSPTIRPL